MHKGLVASIALHCGILLWAVVSFAGKDMSVPESQPIPVDLVSPTELTKIKAGVKDAKEEARAAEPKPEPPKPVAKKETPPPKREQKAEAEPAPAPQAKAPEPKPVEKKPEPRPEPKKVVEKKPEPPKPKPKPAAVEKDGDKAAAKDAPKKKQNDFNPDRIAALLNKAPDAGAPPRPEAPPAPQEKARGRESGQDMTMSISEIDALRARISQCWSPPVGGIGADAIRVRLRMQLAPDGTLTSNPQVVNTEPSPFFQAAADSAVRAVMLCQPYQLPSAKYELWRDMIINFDPRDMFRG
ncbi:MAG: cell envelope biogenesis protein TolA [Hyphomicrobiales bacterium]